MDGVEPAVRSQREMKEGGGGKRSDLGALHRKEDAENHLHQQGAVAVVVQLSQ